MPDVIAWMPFNTLALPIEKTDRRYPLETGRVLIGYWADAVTAVLRSSGPARLRIIKRIRSNTTTRARLPHRFPISPIGAITRLHRRLADDAICGGLSGTDRRLIRHLIKSRKARIVHPLMAVHLGRQHIGGGNLEAALNPSWARRPHLSFDFGQPARLAQHRWRTNLAKSDSLHMLSLQISLTSTVKEFRP